MTLVSSSGESEAFWREEVTQVVGDDGVVHGGKFPLAVGEWRDQIAVDV